jgi:multidrug efflux system membrane fusion protein
MCASALSDPRKARAAAREVMEDNVSDDPESSPPVRWRRISTLRLVFAGLMLVAIAAGGFFFQRALSAQAQPVPASRPAAIPVTATKASTRDLPIERSGIGTVVALSTVDVKVRVDGQLQKLAFKEGQAVQAGDLLAQIDPRPYQAQLALAEANYQKDTAQLGNAKRDEARAARLATTGAGTTQALDTAKSLVDVMQATVAGDQAAIDTAKLNLDFATIKAPVSGRVGLHQVNEGAMVHATDSTGIVTITQMRPISVLFSLPQDELPALVGGQLHGDLPVAVDSRDGQQHLADGKLTVIDSQVDTATGMVRLKAEFANENQALWPGELVTARVRLRTDPNMTVVPSAAVQNGQDGQFVFVVKPDSTVTAQPVKSGPTVENYTALLSGPKSGQEVVVSGQSRLTEGTRVSASQQPQATSNLASTGGL